MPRRNFETKSQVIYRELKRGILSEKYKPHQRIIISEVAKSFNCSEIPVREALKHLESDGLVVNTPYVGAVVTRINIEDIVKLYDIRKILEGMAARRAAKNIKKNDVDMLEKTTKAIETAISAGKYESLSPLYKKFYSIIYAASGNEYLYKVIFDLWNLSFRSPGLLSKIPGRDRRSLQGLKRIVRAVRKKDEDLLEQLIIKQKENALADWMALYKGTPSS